MKSPGGKPILDITRNMTKRSPPPTSLGRTTEVQAPTSNLQAPTFISLRLEATAAAVGVVNNWVSTLSPRSSSRRGMCQATKVGEEDSVLDYPPTQHSMETGKESWKVSCRKRRVKKISIT